MSTKDEKLEKLDIRNVDDGLIQLNKQYSIKALIQKIILIFLLLLCMIVLVLQFYHPELSVQPANQFIRA